MTELKLIKKSLNSFLDILESLLSILVLIGVFVFLIKGIPAFYDYNWASIDTFYVFIEYILAVVVGIEFAKLLITHDIFSIATLLNFVIARKLLSPELTAVDLFFGILAFGVLFVLSIYGKKYKELVKQGKVEKISFNKFFIN